MTVRAGDRGSSRSEARLAQGVASAHPRELAPAPLMTFTATLPVLGRGNGRETVLLIDSHASSLISARRARRSAILLAGKKSSAVPIRRVERQTAPSELLRGNDITEVNADPPKAREIGCVGLRQSRFHEVSETFRHNLPLTPVFPEGSARPVIVEPVRNLSSRLRHPGGGFRLAAPPSRGG